MSINWLPQNGTSLYCIYLDSLESDFGRPQLLSQQFQRSNVVESINFIRPNKRRPVYCYIAKRICFVSISIWYMKIGIWLIRAIQPVTNFQTWSIRLYQAKSGELAVAVWGRLIQLILVISKLTSGLVKTFELSGFSEPGNIFLCSPIYSSCESHVKGTH